MAVRSSVRSTTKTSRDVQASLRPRPLPKEFVCVDPDAAEQLFDFLNGANKAVNKEAVAVHLRLCFRCQESVLHMKDINKALLQEILVS